MTGVQTCALPIVTYPVVPPGPFCLGGTPFPHGTFCGVSLVAHVRTTHPGAKGVCVPPLRWLGTKAWAGSHVAPAPSTQPRPASWGSAELVLGELSRGPGHGVWESPLAMRVGWLPPPGPPRPAHLPLRAAAPSPAPVQELPLSSWREEKNGPLSCANQSHPDAHPMAPTQQARPQPRTKPCGATLRPPGLWGPGQGRGQSREPGGCSGPRLGPGPRPGTQGWLWSPFPGGRETPPAPARPAQTLEVEE